jgi:entericidin B
MLKRLVAAALAAVFAAGLSACNTVQGIGKDVEKAGEAIQKSTK